MITSDAQPGLDEEVFEEIIVEESNFVVDSVSESKEPGSDLLVEGTDETVGVQILGSQNGNDLELSREENNLEVSNSDHELCADDNLHKVVDGINEQVVLEESVETSEQSSANVQGW